MAQEPITEEWNGEIIDGWDKPVDLLRDRTKSTPIIDVWDKVDKTELNGNADTHKDQRKDLL